MRYKIHFPAVEPFKLGQDEAFFTLVENNEEIKLRFHDYDELYKRPGLYEQLFYDRLKCSSPSKVTKILYQTLENSQSRFSELRVLDVGAGNGIVGEALSSLGVARLVGLDISQAACDSADRDRGGVYDAYYVVDLTNLSPEIKEEVKSWQFNCMVTVAALGFDDIPIKAFLEAFNIISDNGWVAFNIKETFLDNKDKTGFSLFIKNLIVSEYLDIYHLERYMHRLSIDGQPLYYYALVGKKNFSIPLDFLVQFKEE